MSTFFYYEIYFNQTALLAGVEVYLETITFVFPNTLRCSSRITLRYPRLPGV